MDGYHESLKAIEKAAAEIFATAETEEEVCKLEQAIYDEINRIAAARIMKPD